MQPEKGKSRTWSICLTPQLCDAPHPKTLRLQRRKRETPEKERLPTVTPGGTGLGWTQVPRFPMQHSMCLLLLLLPYPLTSSLSGSRALPEPPLGFSNRL